MGIARQLYQLQELDQEIEAEEQALNSRVSQMGESQAVVAARAGLAAEQQKLGGLKHQQQSAEVDIEHLTTKIKATDDKLYGGKVRNPKELTDLQHEAAALKAKSDNLESKVLETMEQVELTEGRAATTSNDLKRLESEWQSRQQKLSAEIDQLRSKLTGMKKRRQAAAEGVDPVALRLYEKLRKEKRLALAKIEQGICRGCRISLSSNEIQQARSGNMVQCSSCGRILFLP